MPKTTKSGKPKRSELPNTLLNSGGKAQRTYAQAYDSAVDQYDDEQRAQQTAWAALKRTHEKVGDRWRKKEKGRHGPSDRRAEEGRDSSAPTAGGVDANATRAHLYEQAKRLEIPGRSGMSKAELVEALQKANDRASAKSLERKREKKRKKGKRKG